VERFVSERFVWNWIQLVQPPTVRLYHTPQCATTAITVSSLPAIHAVNAVMRSEPYGQPPK
jgi:hypothetical protein